MYKKPKVKHPTKFTQNVAAGKFVFRMCKYNIPTKYLATAPIPPPINIEKTFNIYTFTLIKSSKMSQASETNFEQCSFLALPSKPELKTLQQVTLFNFTNRSTS